MRLLGYLVIPLFIIAYGLQQPIISDNFTGIANKSSLSALFFLLSIVSLFYLYACFNIFRKYHWHPWYLKPTSIVIVINLLLSAWIPYQALHPHLELLHVYLALSACVLFLFLIGKFIIDLQWTFPLVYQKIILKYKFIIVTLLILLLGFGNINSLIEMVVLIGMNWLITYLYHLK